MGKNSNVEIEYYRYRSRKLQTPAGNSKVNNMKTLIIYRTEFGHQLLSHRFKNEEQNMHVLSLFALRMIRTGDVSLYGI